MLPICACPPAHVWLIAGLILVTVMLPGAIRRLGDLIVDWAYEPKSVSCGDVIAAIGGRR